MDDQIILSYTPASQTAPKGDPGRQVKLHLRALVVPEIEYQPGRLEFTGGTPGLATLELAPGFRPTFEVRGVTITSRAVEAEYNPARKQVTVRYKPKGELDYGHGIQVLVETDGKAEPVLAIPVVIRRLAGEP